ncbi:integrase (plasmid) [Bacillus mycoides]|uniref:Integrase n=1 Tax=Bacillus mycoides TaxID=1405 RepID=A0A1W6AH95_BACMY|nr:integrase [Bacillus mycoides]
MVDRPKAYKSELKVWDIGEVKSFLKVAESSRYYIAFLLALTTGMRQGEILALRWKDINFNNNTLSIKQTLNHAGNKMIAGAKIKSGQRSTTLPNETINFLVRHKEIIDNEKRVAGVLFMNHDLVVCTNIGTPCLPRNLLRSFYSLIEKIDITKIRSHDLRHTHATLLLKEGVHPKVIVNILLNTYSRVLLLLQLESVQKN